MLLGLLSVMKSQADQYKGFKDHTLEWRLVELDLPVAMALQQSPQPLANGVPQVMRHM